MVSGQRQPPDQLPRSQALSRSALEVRHVLPSKKSFITR